MYGSPPNSLSLASHSGFKTFSARSLNSPVSHGTPSYARSSAVRRVR
jgi:hypothetical protein